MKKLSTACWLAVLFCLTPRLLPAIEAGVSRMEITPRTGLKMAGFGGRVAGDVLDPLFVHAVVFRSGDKSVGFVVYDLIGPFGREVGDLLRRELLSRTGLDEVVFSATHTHSGPAINTGSGPERSQVLEELPEHERLICEKTVEALVLACGSLGTVRIGSGLGTADLSYNRIRPRPDGSVEMVWANHEKVPMGPVDRTVGVVRIDDLQGKPVAVLVNYACHPVIHGKPDANLMYSADFPGVLRREVEARLDGNPLCIFFQGACGNLNPYYAHSVENPGPRLQEAGAELAGEVVRVAGQIETRPYSGESPLLCRITELDAPLRWDLDQWHASAEDERARERIEKLAAGRDKLKLPLSVVLITPEIGFVGLPGEFFVEYQQELRKRSPVAFLLVCGYTNGSFGYFPDIASAAAGGYGANDYATYAAVGTGEHLVVEALVDLQEMLGELRPVPADPGKGYRY
ncbi:MAG: hypothetical protein JXQ83_15645 [Candidatus Glassbacteria bacterium]|nr:hypothetical protein [Candidatus Glassbacteria bacterium]